MERNQVLIVIGVLVAFLVVIGGAVYFSGQEDGGIRSQRFRADPGTERESAEPVYSSRTDRDSTRSGTRQVSGSAATSNTEGGDADSDSPQDSPEQESNDSLDDTDRAADKPDQRDAATDDLAAQDEETTKAETMVLAALNAISPDEGFRHLADAAAALTAEDAAADIYTAAAKLHLRSQPPNTDAAWDALQQGAAHATSADEKAQVAVAQAAFLEETGKTGEASQLLRQQFSGIGQASPATIQGVLRLGGLEETEGNTDAAVGAYSRAIELAADLLRRKDPGASGLYRQAAMRLSRLYRASGQVQQAEAVVEAMRAKL